MFLSPVIFLANSTVLHIPLCAQPDITIKPFEVFTAIPVSSIVASSVPEGKIASFSGVPNNEGAVQGASVAFVMPANAVAITVTLIDAPSGQFTVSTSDSASNYSGLGKYNAGSQVTITYTGAKEVEGWMVNTATHQNVNFTTGNKSCTFTMPSENVEVIATTPIE